MSRERIDLGNAGEKKAARFLRDKGYRIITQNFRRKSGEIDIIALDGTTYVFVEVKTRRNRRYGDPAEAVTRSKQRQISRTALEYLVQHSLLDAPVRFDVIAVTVTGEREKLDHIISAFDMPQPSRS